MVIFADQCRECREPLSFSKTGRPRQYCSNKCRQAQYRKRVPVRPAVVDPIPEVLRSRARWILHRDKRPVALGGWWSSIHDRSTWLSYAEAREAVKTSNADGFGFVLNGDGIVCLDLDDCVEAGEPNVFARDFIRALGETYVEFSPSGRGLHVWGFADIAKGKILAGNNLKVEVYPDKRFITMTGRPYRDGALARLHIINALRLVA